jgi:hypothetical protein
MELTNNVGGRVTIGIGSTERDNGLHASLHNGWVKISNRTMVRHLNGLDFWPPVAQPLSQVRNDKRDTQVSIA